MKKKALEYWRKLTEEDRAAIITKAPEYVRSTSGENRQFRSFLEGWINPTNRKWERPVIVRRLSPTDLRKATEPDPHAEVTLGQRYRNQNR